ncbi:Bug family tripartite tricarboxylate transporter substrate binding protein [Azohydromonas lata]|uniref:Bug family tripartite tricarboxylate transporter substrate binding protein n=1 Tax=Azohydromonas lata TaxID=45677 RepID=UPI0012F4E839|nr:tripartite tricarboxylate transporter substrate binding protein [Azohydromonas lata]
MIFRDASFSMMGGQEKTIGDLFSDALRLHSNVRKYGMFPSSRIFSAGRSFWLASLLCCATLGHAQGWPSKPIQIIVPSTPGGAIDSYARVSAEHLAQQVKQPVVVENRPGGGGGLIATEAAARAAADGYSLFVGTAAILTINPSAYKKLPYSPGDFTYLCKGVEFPLVLVAHPSTNARTIDDLARWLQANPKNASYASYQPGTPSHFLGYQLGEKLGIPLTHIPYRGSAPQVTDLLGGNVFFGFTQLPTALPHIKSGRLIALATTGTVRPDSLKDVATLAEQGLGDLTTTAWFGLLAPKGIPVSIAQRLIKAHLDALGDTNVKAKMAAQGLSVSGVCGQEFQDAVKQEAARWARVVKATGFSANE